MQKSLTSIQEAQRISNVCRVMSRQSSFSEFIGVLARHFSILTTTQLARTPLNNPNQNVQQPNTRVSRSAYNGFANTLKENKGRYIYEKFLEDVGLAIQLDKSTTHKTVESDKKAAMHRLCSKTKRQEEKRHENKISMLILPSPFMSVLFPSVSYRTVFLPSTKRVWQH